MFTSEHSQSYQAIYHCSASVGFASVPKRQAASAYHPSQAGAACFELQCAAAFLSEDLRRPNKCWPASLCVSRLQVCDGDQCHGMVHEIA